MPNPAQRFNASKPAAKPAVKAPPRRASRFAGITPGGDNDPIISASDTWQRIKILSTEESKIVGRKPFFKVKMEILESDVHTPGDVVGYLQCTDSKSEAAALPRIAALSMAAIGAPDLENFQAFDPDGYFSELVCGQAESYVTPDGLDWLEAGTEFGPNPLEGIELMALVSRGKDVKTPDGRLTGDYYRNIKWAQPGTEDQA